MFSRYRGNGADYEDDDDEDDEDYDDDDDDDDEMGENVAPVKLYLGNDSSSYASGSLPHSGGGGGEGRRGVRSSVSCESGSLAQSWCEDPLCFNDGICDSDCGSVEAAIDDCDDVALENEKGVEEEEEEEAEEEEESWIGVMRRRLENDNSLVITTLKRLSKSMDNVAVDG